MATEYEAIVRVRTEAVAPVREGDVVALLRERLPTQAAVDHHRDNTDSLVLRIGLPLQAEDASQVQISAQELAWDALQHAGRTEEAFTLDDVSVEASS